MDEAFEVLVLAVPDGHLVRVEGEVSAQGARHPPSPQCAGRRRRSQKHHLGSRLDNITVSVDTEGYVQLHEWARTSAK
jgi:hypothetical protein